MLPIASSSSLAEPVVCDYYRCPFDLASIDTQSDLSGHSGYFRFGDAVGFGRVAGGRTAHHAADDLVDVADAVTTVNGRPCLPFSLSEVTTNLRRERYRQRDKTFTQKATTFDAVHRLYYLARPLLPIGVRKHLQRVRLHGWDKIAFPRWPVDWSVDTLIESAMTLLLKAGREPRIPFIWFWPEGASSCAMMTHDVEGPSGLAFCDELMDIDDSFAVKSAFQLIPEGREESWRRTARRLRARGFEVNLHDLNHDGRLFANKREFLERAKRINAFAKEFDCDGFRSAIMYREQDWFGAFGFAYDMSVPNAAHLEPQRGGCCTVMPYFVDDILELPLTAVQDYSLFYILNDYSTAIWRRQIQLIAERHGLVSVITHPDYLVGKRERRVYADLLQHLVELRARNQMWVALPGEINRWWRNRQQMRLVRDGADGWRIEGPDSQRARIAWASLEGDVLVYRLGASRPRTKLAAIT